MINLRNDTIPADCILIHTDGYCVGNPGPGGWAASLRRIKRGEAVKKLIVQGCDPATTNIRMKLKAALMAIRSLRRDEVSPIIIRSDSRCLIVGMTEWTNGFIEKRWRTTHGKSIENADLWIDLLSEASTRTLTWRCMRGQIRDKYSEEADAIAQAQAMLSCGAVAAR